MRNSLVKIALWAMLTLAAKPVVCEAAGASSNGIIMLPLTLSLTNPFVWTNAVWWTNVPPQTSIETWQAWWSVNENWGRLTNTIAGITGGLGDAQTNAILNSQRIAALTTNGFYLAAGASNVLGWVTNLAGVTYATTLGEPELLFSYDGTNYVTGRETLVTNTRVRISFSSGSGLNTNATAPTRIPLPGAVTNVTLWKMVRPDLFGITNALFGERLFVNDPESPSEAASKNYVDKTFLGTSWWSAGAEVQLNQYALNFNSEWRQMIDGSQAQIQHWQFRGLDSFKVSYSESLNTTNALTASVDESGTNVVVSLSTNGVSSGARLLFSHQLVPLNWQGSAVAPVLVGATWVFTVPLPWTDSGFCTVRTPSGDPGFIDLSCLLRLTSTTITNANSTTWGKGAGLVCTDSNYLYISVWTNSWKRAALATW